MKTYESPEASIFHSFFKHKKILVTGGTGSIGSEIVRHLLQFETGAIRIFSNDEDGLFNLQQELRDFKELRFLLGDVRDKDRLRMACEDVDVVFHTAALKHVPTCEYNPFEAVRTNVIGTQNLLEVALLENVEKFTFISTDKAVNPTSTMGASKLLCERLVTDACSYRGKRRTTFCCVRFGNVLGSRGSVTEIFQRQIKNGGPVTITHPKMTRFVMLLPQAIDLIFKATEMAKGGEIFVAKIPALSIRNLAEVMIEELAPKYNYHSDEIEMEVRGIRPGEKLHEELMTRYEAKNSIERKDMFVIYPPGIKVAEGEGYELTRLSGYSSKNAKLLTKPEIKQLLQAANIF